MDGEDGAAPAPFPWEAAMEAGLSRLRLPARDFWGMTP
ncbi:MAG: phage tail assembly chaperone, partial [Pararhizobium sp.]